MKKEKNTRIYLVEESGNKKLRLVEASSSSVALKHVVTPLFYVSTASPRDVAKAMASGATVERAGEQE